MFRNLASQLTAAAVAKDGSSSVGGGKKELSPALRADIYSLIDKTRGWISGGQSGGQAGDGVSYNSLLTPIQKHLPETKKLGLESFGQLDSEIGVIVGGVTNLILELSKWEGMSSGMAMRTWVDTLVDGYFKAASAGESRKELIAKGILRGLNQYTDATLLTKDFTTRIQIITCLKTVSSRIYGPGSEEARQNEAVWSSKFI